MSDKQNGWNEYSRLVLAELEKLNNKVDGLTEEINAIKQDISKFDQIKYNVGEVKEWKKEIDEISSPTQLKETIKEVSELKTFKTVAITVWTVVQIVFTIAITLWGLYLKSG